MTEIPPACVRLLLCLLPIVFMLVIIIGIFHFIIFMLFLIVGFHGCWFENYKKFQCSFFFLISCKDQDIMAQVEVILKTTVFLYYDLTLSRLNFQLIIHCKQLLRTSLQDIEPRTHVFDIFWEQINLDVVSPCLLNILIITFNDSSDIFHLFSLV